MGNLEATSEKAAAKPKMGWLTYLFIALWTVAIFAFYYLTGKLQVTQDWLKDISVLLIAWGIGSIIAGALGGLIAELLAKKPKEKPEG